MLQDGVQFEKLIQRELIRSLQGLSPFVAVNLVYIPSTVLFESVHSIPLNVPKVINIGCLGCIAILAFGSNTGFIAAIVNRVLCLPLATVIQHVFKDIWRDLNIDLDLPLFLPLLHISFDVIEDLFEMPWQQPMMVPSFVWPAVGPLLAILASAAMMLIDAGPETSIGDSLKLLRLGSALSLLLSPSRPRVARRFLENKLYAKNNLPLLAEQGPEGFHMAIQYMPIDL